MEPRDVSEVLEALADARSREEKIAIRTFGHHSPYIKGVKEISLRRLSWFEIKDDLVIAEPGAPVKKVLEEALERGYIIPTTYDGSVGGLIASEFPSPLSARYGNVKDWVKGVSLATYWGKVYSYRGFTGTFGKAGAIVRAELKLFVKPRHAYTLDKTYERLDAEEYYSGVARVPIASLVEYDGKWRVYFSFEEDVDMQGFNKDSGLVGFSYSPSPNTFIARVKGLQEFVGLVERTKPSLAVFMHGSSYALFEAPSETEGLERFGSLDLHGMIMKRLFDPAGLFE